jgi:hypothetical protein
MTKLTTAQHALLDAAAQAADGTIEMGDAAKPTIWSLIKRDLMVAADDTGRLTITDAGRAAIAPAEEPADAAAQDIEPEAAAKPKTPKGKIAALVDLLNQADGTTIEAMMAATGWQAHSVRGAISGAIKKKLGLPVLSEKTEAGRSYRIGQTVDA